MSSRPLIHRVTKLDLVAGDWRWPFADQRRAEIDAYFATLCSAKPTLWNGKVLLAREWRIEGETLSACYFTTDYASFLAWRDWGFPDSSIFNAFGMGALRGQDGGFLLGEMSATTANAGVIYFASGMLDLSDVSNGRIDMAANVAREVAEETGLAPTDYIADPVWHVIADMGRLAMIRRLDSPLAAWALKARIDAFIAREAQPELRTVHVARTRDDVSLAMPPFVRAYLCEQFGAPAPTNGATPR